MANLLSVAAATPAEPLRSFHFYRRHAAVAAVGEVHPTAPREVHTARANETSRAQRVGPLMQSPTRTPTKANLLLLQLLYRVSREKPETNGIRREGYHESHKRVPHDKEKGLSFFFVPTCIENPPTFGLQVVI